MPRGKIRGALYQNGQIASQGGLLRGLYGQRRTPGTQVQGNLLPETTKDPNKPDARGVSSVSFCYDPTRLQLWILHIPA